MASWYDAPPGKKWPFRAAATVKQGTATVRADTRATDDKDKFTPWLSIYKSFWAMIGFTATYATKRLSGLTED